MVLFGDTAIAQGASDSSYVNGTVLKSGSEQFNFPVGADNNYVPIGISDFAWGATTYKARYYNSDPDSLYPRSEHNLSAGFVNRCNYWSLERLEGFGAAVTLSWDSSACYAIEPSQAKILNWTSSQWQDQGIAGYDGTAVSGTVRSSSLYYNTNTIFTLGGPCTLTATISPAHDTLFAGYPAYFTAIPIAIGTDSQAQYRFYVNDVLMQDSSLATFRADSLQNYDQVKVIITDINLCEAETSINVNVLQNPYAFYRSYGNGSWNDTTWQVSTDSSYWYGSNAWPDERAMSILIREGDTISLSAGFDTLNIAGHLNIQGRLRYDSLAITTIVLSDTLHQLITISDTLFVQRLTLNKGDSSQVNLSGHLAIVDTLNFVKGILYPDSLSMVLFGDTAIAQGASDSSYVNGTVLKSGSEQFNFPVGADNNYVPIGISDFWWGATTYKARYYNSDPDSLYPRNEHYGNWSGFVNRCNYWSLERLEGFGAAVTLSWDSSACYAIEPSQAKILNWTSSQWQDQGIAGYDGTAVSGTVRSNSLYYNTNTIFTLGGPCSLEAILQANRDTLFAGYMTKFRALPDSLFSYGFYVNDSLKQEGTLTEYMTSTLVDGSILKLVVTNLDGCQDQAESTISLNSPIPVDLSGFQRDSIIVFGANAILAQDSIFANSSVASTGEISELIEIQGSVYSGPFDFTALSYAQSANALHQYLNNLYGYPLDTIYNDTLNAGIYYLDTTVYLMDPLYLIGDSSSQFVFNVDSLVIDSLFRLRLYGVDPRNVLFNVKRGIHCPDIRQLYGTYVSGRNIVGGSAAHEAFSGLIALDTLKFIHKGFVGFGINPGLFTTCSADSIYCTPLINESLGSWRYPAVLERVDPFNPSASMVCGWESFSGKPRLGSISDTLSSEGYFVSLKTSNHRSWDSEGLISSRSNPLTFHPGNNYKIKFDYRLNRNQFNSADSLDRLLVYLINDSIWNPRKNTDGLYFNIPATGAFLIQDTTGVITDTTWKEYEFDFDLPDSLTSYNRLAFIPRMHTNDTSIAQQLATVDIKNISLLSCCGSVASKASGDIHVGNISTEGAAFSQYLTIMGDSIVISTGWDSTNGISELAQIRIDGNLIVDENLTIRNAHIVFSDSSIIEVKSGARLIIDESAIRGCHQKWDGIYVHRGGSLIIRDGSLIEDAVTGVTSQTYQWLKITRLE